MQEGSSHLTYFLCSVPKVPQFVGPNYYSQAHNITGIFTLFTLPEVACGIQNLSYVTYLISVLTKDSFTIYF